MALCYSRDCCSAALPFLLCASHGEEGCLLLWDMQRRHYRVPLVKYRKEEAQQSAKNTLRAQFIVSGTLKNHQKHCGAHKKNKKTDSNRRRNLSAICKKESLSLMVAALRLHRTAFGCMFWVKGCIVPRQTSMMQQTVGAQSPYRSPLNSTSGGESERQRSAHSFEFLLHFPVHRSHSASLR